jgi:hypothetical protein
MLMDGRSSSTILTILSLTNVKMEINVSSLTVHIFILNRKNDYLCNLGSEFFLKPEQLHFHRIIICHI